TNVITGKKSLILYGDGVLHDTLSNVPVALDPLSFYQVNTAGANLLYSVIAQLAQLKSTDTLLDLYCGAGTIGLSMVKSCAKLIGVEMIPEAIESAKRNATAMGVCNAEFLCADAGKAAQTLAKDGLTPNVVVLDPPRKGCDNATLEAVIQMAPARIVMVSCNPATAARDLQILQKN
ncbi:MAG: methyltransferase domain-containing protein, partial [Ruthenibacterium sp.]